MRRVSVDSGCRLGCGAEPCLRGLIQAALPQEDFLQASRSIFRAFGPGSQGTTEAIKTQHDGHILDMPREQAHPHDSHFTVAVSKLGLQLPTVCCRVFSGITVVDHLAPNLLQTVTALPSKCRWWPGGGRLSMLQL
jgi:hypothetical protein